MTRSVEELNRYTGEGFARKLGLTITDRDSSSGEMEARWDVGETVLGADGLVDNGAVSSAAETLASIAAAAALPEEVRIVGVSNSMQYLARTGASVLDATIRPRGSMTCDSPVWKVSISTRGNDLVAEGTVRLQQL